MTLCSKSRGLGVRVSLGEPFISLESNTCSHFWNRPSFDFRSIRSNCGLLGRKIETKTHSFRNLFAKLQFQVQPHRRCRIHSPRCMSREHLCECRSRPRRSSVSSLGQSHAAFVSARPNQVFDLELTSIELADRKVTTNAEKATTHRRRLGQRSCPCLRP